MGIFQYISHNLQDLNNNPMALLTIVDKYDVPINQWTWMCQALLEVSMNKIALRINVYADDWTAELSAIASNDYENFYRPRSEANEGYVFIGIVQLGVGGGEVDNTKRQPPPPGQYHHLTPRHYAQAGGTHPIGMHSSYYMHEGYRRRGLICILHRHWVTWRFLRLIY